jgi:hypothetical protein
LSQSVAFFENSQKRFRDFSFATGLEEDEFEAGFLLDFWNFGEVASFERKFMFDETAKLFKRIFEF